MENRSSESTLDLTLKARHMRSAYLASLFRRALERLRGDARQPVAPDLDGETAFERR